MSDVKWTKEQKNVIDSRDSNLLVSAAAGSGKTAVLVERIIQMVTDEKNPIDIDKLLVVTFTNAAAAEMKERISNSLIKKLEDEPNNKRIRTQLIHIGNANIMTIHSFCLKVIRNNINLLDIDPAARIGDQGETEILKEEIIEEILENKYKESKNTFIELSNWINTPKSNNNLINLVLKIYTYGMSSPNPELWFKSTLENFSHNKNDFKDTIWGKSIIENFNEDIINLVNSIESIIEDLVGLDGYEKYINLFSEDKENILKLKNNQNSWDGIYDYLREISFSRLPIIKKDIDKEASLVPKAFRDEFKKILGSYRENFSMKTEKINQILRLTEPIIKELVELVIEFSRKYKESKRELKIIDFNDIEHFCLELLSNDPFVDDSGNLVYESSKIGKEMSESFYEILIDEYQDSNLVQETIINMVSGANKGKHNVFMVGDVKQSIYRFRMARPDLFLSKYKSYSEENSAEDKKINLYKNFRSQKEIIVFINSVFSKIMSTKCGEIDYTEKEELISGLESYNDCKPIFALLENTKDSFGDEFITDSALEAKYIASKIHMITKNNEDSEFKIFDKNTNEKRIIKYKDIVILMRSTSTWSEIFLEELEKSGIPVYADSNTGYFDTIEIGIMVSLLKIIDNPKQDIPLLSLLRSGIGNFSDDELVELRLRNKNEIFYNILVESKVDNKKVRDFLLKLERWRSVSKTIEIGDFIWFLYKETGYYAAVSSMEGSEQRIANLRLLAYRATSFEKTSLRGLFSFINYLDKLKTRNQDYGSAKILGEDENLIRIMSIHKSKGLEFPVVFIAGIGKEFNKKDTKEKVLMHQRLGFGPDYISTEEDYILETPPKTAIKILINKESLSEEMRILYVGLTRARDFLFMVSSYKDIENIIEKFENTKLNSFGKLPKENVGSANSFADWLIPCILNDPEKSSIEIIKKEELLKMTNISSVSVEEVILNQNIELNDDNYFEFKKDINALYKTEKEQYSPQKISVTELKRLFEYRDDDIEVKPMFRKNEYKEPEFIKEDIGLSGAEKGKALHYIMQHIDFKNTENIDKLEMQISEMIKKEKLTKLQSESINREKIMRFLNSDLGKRAKESNKVYREIPFIIEYKEMLLQGIIDMYFEEDDGYILIDYKTDFVTKEIIKNKTNDYKVQLDYYKKAIEELTGKRVTEKYIYYFGLDKAEEIA